MYDTNSFKPTKKEVFVNILKDYLLNGYIVRCDGIGDNPIEVIERRFKNNAPNMGNIGSFVNTYDKVNCSHNILNEIIDEFNKEYSLKKVRCESSGCCQYTTYAYYLD